MMNLIYKIKQQSNAQEVIQEMETQSCKIDKKYQANDGKAPPTTMLSTNSKSCAKKAEKSSKIQIE